MVYKKGPRFSVRPVSEICEDIDEAFDLYGAKVRSIFFPAGNSIAMPTRDLAAICRYSMAKFKGLQRITVYGSSQYIVKKGPADLAALRKAGLSRIHVGLESGDDDILKRVKKGTNDTEQIKAGKMVKWFSSGSEAAKKENKISVWASSTSEMIIWLSFSKYIEIVLPSLITTCGSGVR